jgi:hypothetical protein
MSQLHTDLASVGVDKVDNALEPRNVRVVPDALGVSAGRGTTRWARKEGVQRVEDGLLCGFWGRIMSSRPLTLSSGEIRPSGTTAVASTMIRPQPLMAMLPRCTK